MVSFIMEEEKKRKKLIDIFAEVKDIAYNAYKSKEYETSLGVISAAAAYMYKLNLVYNDDDLEKLVEMIADEYIDCNVKNSKFEIKNVLFYDEFGYENRGIASIYVKALINMGYRVIYVTRSYRRGKVNKIENIVNKNGKVVFIERDSYKNEVENLLNLIIGNECRNFIIYSMPQGVVAPVCYYAIRKYNVKIYKINLTDHAYWLGNKAADYFIEFRNIGASISRYYRKIDADKIVKLPFYPEIDDSIEFKGLPFDDENKKIVFSGGSLYKTFDSELIYYKIVDQILSAHKDVIFLYAGDGDTVQLEKLEKKYRGRVYYTGERQDFYQLLKRCYFYLCTYPISGGLMGQYAVKAGKIPMQLLHDEFGGLLLENVDILKCQYYDYDAFMEQVHSLLNDNQKLVELERKTTNQVISKSGFESELKNILLNCSEKSIEYKDIKLIKFQEIYLNEFEFDNIKNILCTKRTTAVYDNILSILVKEKIIK